jgi:hypothetical protein
MDDEFSWLSPTVREVMMNLMVIASMDKNLRNTYEGLANLMCVTQMLMSVIVSLIVRIVSSHSRVMTPAKMM